MFKRLYHLIICMIICWMFSANDAVADFTHQVIEPAVNFLTNEVKQAIIGNKQNNGGYYNNNGQQYIVYYSSNNGNNTNNPFFTPQQSQMNISNFNGGNPNFALVNQGVTSGNILKFVAISSDGRRIARVVQSGNQELVVLRMYPNFERTILNIMNPESVEGVYLVGSRYLVCSIKNSSNNLWHLRVVDLQQNLNQKAIAYRNLTTINNAIYIAVTTPRSANSELICATSFNGATYTTQKVNLRTGVFLYRIDGNQAPLVDKSPDVRIFYNLSTNVLGTQSSYDAFLVSTGTNNVISSNKLLESIGDINRTRYISMVGNTCYKIEMMGDNNSIVLRGINIGSNVISDYGTINGVNSLLDCAVNLDVNGVPCFITVGSGDASKNYPLSAEAQVDLQALSTEFGGIGWSRVGCTGDGKVWILCVYTQPASRFFIYDSRNGGISEVTVGGLQPTKYLNRQQALVNQSQIPNNGMMISPGGVQLTNQPMIMNSPGTSQPSMMNII